MRGRSRSVALGLSIWLFAAGARGGDVFDALAEAAVGEAAETLTRVATDPPSSAESEEEEVLPELRDWVDPETFRTSRMAAGCGLLVETTLRTRPSRNVLHVVAANQSDRLLRFAPLWVRFSSGLSREMGGAPAVLAKTARNSYSFDFPSKQDFAGQSWLEVVFAVESHAGSCRFTIRHERWTSMAQRRESLIEYSNVEFWFGGGLRLAAAGGLRQFGRDEGLALEFGAAGLLTANHGYTIDLLVDQASSSPASRLDGFGIALGYAVRAYPLGWLSLSYGPALGHMAYSLDGAEREQANVFIFQQRLRVQARVLPQRRGRFGLYFAPSFTYTLVTGGQLGGIQLRGSSAAALLSLGLGL